TRSAISASVPLTVTSSGRVANPTTATGQSAPYTGVSSRTTRGVWAAARWMTAVAPDEQTEGRSSPAGIGVARPSTRVRITDCDTCGTVSSTPSPAAAAANAGTPGTISHRMPSAPRAWICSATAEYTDGSPE